MEDKAHKLLQATPCRVQSAVLQINATSSAAPQAELLLSQLIVSHASYKHPGHLARHGYKRHRGFVLFISRKHFLSGCCKPFAPTSQIPKLMTW